MKQLIGVLYVLTGLVGLFWSIRLTLTGLYAVPFSPWYILVCIGSVILIIGAFLSRTPTGSWTLWLPIIGSLLLASYFVPATVDMLRSYSRSEIVGGIPVVVRLACVGLVLASLAASVMNGLGHLPNRSLR